MSFRTVSGFTSVCFYAQRPLMHIGVGVGVGVGVQRLPEQGVGVGGGVGIGSLLGGGLGVGGGAGVGGGVLEASIASSHLALSLYSFPLW